MISVCMMWCVEYDICAMKYKSYMLCNEEYDLQAWVAKEENNLQARLQKSI